MTETLYPVRPRGKVDVVLDTDAFNETDDQFAIAYMLAAPEKLRIRALCAAPFFNAHSSSPADGMEKSYQEILHLLRLAGREDLTGNVYRGAEGYLPDEKTPVVTPAARVIRDMARAHTPEDPLYVVGIAAITNVASALLMDPDIRDRMVVVWLGGHAYHWPHDREFNLRQDVAAARVVFDCGVRLVQLPCMGVVSEAATTGWELNAWLRGKGPLCTYLCDHTIAEAESYARGTAWSRIIWDVTAVAWLLDEDGRMLQDRPEHSPIPQYDGHYSFDPARHLICYVWNVNRDALFTDLFTRIGRLQAGSRADA